MRGVIGYRTQLRQHFASMRSANELPPAGALSLFVVGAFSSLVDSILADGFGMCRGPVNGVVLSLRRTCIDANTVRQLIADWISRRDAAAALLVAQLDLESPRSNGGTTLNERSARRES